MKRFLLYIALLFSSLFAVAQTQQGYVRTLGRPEKAGVPLGEVNIKVKGQHNTVNSNGDGTFEMVLEGLHNGDPYSLSQVRKNGYELNESDFIGRPLAFSDKVRLEIVMVSSAQLQADKRRIENNAYKTAEKNYQAQYDLLEKQLNDNAISAEQYRKRILELQDKFERYQSLIDGLAEHYAHTDYDLLDEKDREINLCIENGELERADSLIRLLFDPIGVLERNIEALASLDRQISQAGEDLAQANADMAAVLKQQEKDAEYLYQLYTIALARYDNEKAQFYIETRAALDETNPEWQNQAGRYLYLYLGDYKLAGKYFDKALTHALEQYGPNNDYTATIYSNIGLVRDMEGNVDAAMECHNKSIEIWRELFGRQSFEVTVGYNNLATVYYKKDDYNTALDYFQQSLEIRKNLLGAYSLPVAACYNNLGATYDALNDYEQALKCYMKSLTIRDSLQEPNHPDKAVTYSNIGYALTAMGRHAEARASLRKALDIYLNTLGKNHPNTAAAYNNLGWAYLKGGRTERAIECFSKALEMEQNIYGPDHPEVTTTEMNLAGAYFRAGDALAKKQDYVGAFEDFFEAWFLYRRHPLTKTGAIVMENLYTMLNVFMIVSPGDELQETYDIFMSDIAFTVTDSSTSYLLEYGPWTCESYESLFEVEKDLGKQPVSILVLQNGRIRKIEERPATDYNLKLSFVGQEEKKKIISAYHRYIKK